MPCPASFSGRAATHERHLLLSAPPAVAVRRRLFASTSCDASENGSARLSLAAFSVGSCRRTMRRLRWRAAESSVPKAFNRMLGPSRGARKHAGGDFCVAPFASTQLLAQWDGRPNPPNAARWPWAAYDGDVFQRRPSCVSYETGALDRLELNPRQKVVASDGARLQAKLLRKPQCHLEAHPQCPLSETGLRLRLAVPLVSRRSIFLKRTLTRVQAEPPKPSRRHLPSWPVRLVC